MITQPPDTAAEKLAAEIFHRLLMVTKTLGLAAQLTTANERADLATAEAAVLLERATALTREAVYHRGGKEYTVTDKTFSPLYSAVMNLATIAAAHLAEHRRLVEGQRTEDTKEVCIDCCFTNDGRNADGYEMVHRDRAHCPRVVCPIRAGGT